MNKKQLLQKLNGTEWTDLECKESKKNLPKDIWKTVSAFANTEGGYIILGVKQEGNKFIITGVDNPDKIQNDFISTLRGEKFNIELATTGYQHQFTQGTVLVFRIDEMPRQAKPIHYSNEMRNTFIRLGGSTQKASKDEISRMVRDASEKSSDSMVLDGFCIDDLDQKSIQTFLRFLEARQPGHHLLSCSIEELLLNLQAVVKTNKNKYIPTSAGLLLFGKSIRILNQFPSYFMDFLDKRGIDKKDFIHKRWSEFGYHVPKIKDDKQLNYFQLTLPLIRKKALSSVKKSTKQIEKKHQVQKKAPSIEKGNKLSEKGTKLNKKGTKLNEKGTKLNEKGTKLNEKREQVIKILGLSKNLLKPEIKLIEDTFLLLKFCVQPKTIDELMLKINRRSRNKFRNKLLNLLLKEEVVSMTFPETPNSPNQKYVITEKGRKIINDED
jgi:hypothetical protein